MARTRIDTRSNRGRNRATLLKETHITGLTSPFETYWNDGEQYQTEVITTRYMQEFYCAGSAPDWAGYQKYLEGLFGNYTGSYSSYIWQEELSNTEAYEQEFLNRFNVSSVSELLSFIDDVIDSAKNVEQMLHNYDNYSPEYKDIYGLLTKTGNFTTAKIRQFENSLTDNVDIEETWVDHLLNYWSKEIIYIYDNSDVLSQQLTNMNIEIVMDGRTGVRKPVYKISQGHRGNYGRSLKERSEGAKDTIKQLADIQKTRKEQTIARDLYDILESAGFSSVLKLEPKYYEKLYDLQVGGTGEDIYVNQTSASLRDILNDCIERNLGQVRREIIKLFATQISDSIHDAEDSDYIYRTIMQMADTPDGANSLFARNKINLASKMGEIVGGFILFKLSERQGKNLGISFDKSQALSVYNAARANRGDFATNFLRNVPEEILGTQIKGIATPSLRIETNLQDLLQKVEGSGLQLDMNPYKLAYYYASKAFYNTSLNANLQFIESINDFLITAISYLYSIQVGNTLSKQNSAIYMVGNKIVFVTQILKAIRNAFMKLENFEIQAGLSTQTLDQDADVSGLIVPASEEEDIDTEGVDMRNPGNILKSIRVSSRFNLSEIISANVNSWTTW